MAKKSTERMLAELHEELRIATVKARLVLRGSEYARSRRMVALIANEFLSDRGSRILSIIYNRMEREENHGGGN